MSDDDQPQQTPHGAATGMPGPPPRVDGDDPPEPEPEAGPAPERPSVPKRGPQLQRQLGEFFAGLSVAAGAAGDLYSAQVIAAKAEPMAEVWYRLAQQNDRVKAILERLVAGSAWGEAMVVTATVVLPIAHHHGLIELDPFGLMAMGAPIPQSDEVGGAGAGGNGAGA